MTYFIIFIVIALVVSPIVWMIPSPRQKRQARLRQHAMKMGFQVKVCDLPQTQRAKVRKEQPIHGVVYRLPWRQRRHNKEQFRYLQLRQEMSQSVSNSSIDNILSRQLELLPDEISAIDFDNNGIGLYWTEKGSVTTVDSMFKALETLKPLLERFTLGVADE